MSLSPCSSCHRHIKSTEVSCPFCEAPQASKPSPASLAIARGASRAQRFAAVAAVAASAACLDKTPTIDDGGVTPPDDEEMFSDQPVYGSPLPDDNEVDVDRDNEDPNLVAVPVYGAVVAIPLPPDDDGTGEITLDAGTDDAGTRDAGSEDTGRGDAGPGDAGA